MKTKHLPPLLIGLLALGVFVSTGAVVWLSPKPGVTKANFDRIKDGMTMAEVVRVFGGYSEGFGSDRTGGGVPFTWHRWDANDGSLAMVWFAADGCVIQTAWRDSTETLWDKLLRWLRLK